MKKAIAILLAALMLLSCVSVVSFAADITSENQAEWGDATDTLNKEYVIKAGATWSIKNTVTLSGKIIVEEGATLVIEQGASITVSGTGRIENYGTVIVKNQGLIFLAASGASDNDASFLNEKTGVITLNTGSVFFISTKAYAFNKGKINNIERMKIEGGYLYHYITFPQNFDVEYKNTEMWNRQNTVVSFKVEYVSDSDLSAETDYLIASNYKSVPVSGGWFEHGVKLYVLITPEDGDGDWVDTGRMMLNVNGNIFGAKDKIDNDRGVFTVIPVGAMDMSVASTAYKDIVKLFKIILPRSEGYYVKTKDGDVDEVIIEFGKTLSFTVILDKEYDLSTPSAYAGMDYLEPDEYGYFDVKGYKDGELQSAGGIQDNFSITIMNVSSNEKREQTNSIVNFIKQIFETIQSIFGYFGDLFSDIFGGIIPSTPDNGEITTVA